MKWTDTDGHRQIADCRLQIDGAAEVEKDVRGVVEGEGPVGQG